MKICGIRKKQLPLHRNSKECTIRFDSLAQQVEHNTFNVGVLGSSPKRITKKEKRMFLFLFKLFHSTLNLHSLLFFSKFSLLFFQSFLPLHQYCILAPDKR